MGKEVLANIHPIYLFMYPTSITIRYVEQYKVTIRNNTCNHISTKYNIIDVLFHPLHTIHHIHSILLKIEINIDVILLVVKS